MEKGEKSYSLSLFIRVWALLFGSLGCTAAFLTGFSVYVILAALAAVVLAVPVCLFIHFSGNSVVDVLFGLGGNISVRRQLKAELDKARHLIRKGNYEDAYQLIVSVLETVQDFDDALLIRAEIEMRTGRSLDAEETLKTLLRTADPGFVQRRWALCMLTRLRGRREQPKNIGIEEL